MAYAPRKPTDGVDVQLVDFENTLRNHLEFQLIVNTNRNYWHEMDVLHPADTIDIENAIHGSFLDIIHRYQGAQPVLDILTHCQILINNVVWAAMNVPYPANPDLHIERVVDNAVQVYIQVIYPQLRTEMMMANHMVHIVQRTWRRIVADPQHPACRRRLLREFDAMV
jgi:hypothetical protein